ncbi:TrlF family AAA-like ATPase [Desulfovibrio sp. Fe33]|uniref:TrlF family AAA-like ATPase n=1 Tax=Desulfovibrio sp. Fe33 TaxID=3020842 RepID=UPI00234E1156|nr:hypothetical protein [Desulfovibrio sp. Fe33]
MGIFDNGSVWLRADFHLHTNADKEFTYPNEPQHFFHDYVQALKDAGISIGVITNHNKFEHEEFKTLRQKAKREGVFLLPGVELSVNDGANGIHTLVVFSDKWLENGNDYINNFLAATFSGKAKEEYQRENGRSSQSLLQTIQKLEEYNRDFFIIFAHVEQKSGLWNELDGGRLQELGKHEAFRRRALGFQKVRTHNVTDKKCRTKAQDWLGEAYPAEVEGSDCKGLDGVGNGKKSYLKVGDFTFEAVKYALLDHEHRLATEPVGHECSHIISVGFEGGALDGKTVYFSPELNTLIGIRGSGKSSIIEAIRYTLDIPLGPDAIDRPYREKLVEHILGSGGRVVITAKDQRGQLYQVVRILKGAPDVYVDGNVQRGISIRETVLNKPIYFGQKDLSSAGEGFEKDLVEKLVGEKLVDVRANIKRQEMVVGAALDNLHRLSQGADDRETIEAKKQNAIFKLKFYKKHGVEAKMSKQTEFDKDSTACADLQRIAKHYLDELENFIDVFDDELKEKLGYESQENKQLFENILSSYSKLLTSFAQIKKELATGKEVLEELKTKISEFDRTKESLKEEFAKIERSLAEELKQDGAVAISPDEFLTLTTTVTEADKALAEIGKKAKKKEQLEDELHQSLADLNELWREEFVIIQSELEKVNQNHTALQIDSEFKEDKKAYLEAMVGFFKGSKIRKTTLEALVQEYPDFGAMRRNLADVLAKQGTSAQTFEEYFALHYKEMLVWQVPNLFRIKYRDKELRHHSLGQRASALILFVLSQQENDVIIIDQPEDDLDNQTIYEDVIKLIRKLKPSTQFIFATHNANFPVLGDAEQIIACKYSDNKISLSSGSIDCPTQQQDVVDIMEGGEEAFNQRKRIYEIWSPEK